MNREERDDVYKKAIELWGEDSQVLVAIEELSELITQLAKRNRVLNGSSNEKIIDEIADGFVMLESISNLYNKEKIDERIEYKVNRLKSWIEDDVTVW